MKTRSHIQFYGNANTRKMLAACSLLYFSYQTFWQGFFQFLLLLFSDNEYLNSVVIDCEWSDRIYASIFSADQVNTLKLLVEHTKIHFSIQKYYAGSGLRVKVPVTWSLCFSRFKYCVFFNILLHTRKHFGRTTDCRCSVQQLKYVVIVLICGGNFC